LQKNSYNSPIGYETTSSTLTYLAHNLVNYPEVQDKIREEINAMLTRDGVLDYNTLAELPYMEAVIQESLRLYPPISHFVNRVAARDYEFKGRLIPKGTQVLIPIYQLHKDSEKWPEPEEFRPERFTKENKANVNWTFWQPFGGGPRNCIGMRFALLEIKLALAKLLIKFKLEAGPNTEIGVKSRVFKGNLIQPKNGVKLRAVPLSKQN